MSAKAEKTCRPVGAGGAGDFWGSVNPKSTSTVQAVSTGQGKITQNR